PPSIGRPASSGTPGRSGSPETSTAPGGASRQAVSTSSPSPAMAISYGPDNCASPTASAYPVNRGCLVAIGATVASAVSAAARYAGSPVNAVYAVSAAAIEDRPDGVALSVGSAGRVTRASASSAVSWKPPRPSGKCASAVSSNRPARSSQRPSPVAWCSAQYASATHP